MRKAEDRYLNDPAFSMLVNLIFSMIEKGQFTPTELREAAMLAAIKYERYRPNLIMEGYESYFSKGKVHENPDQFRSGRNTGEAQS